MIKIQNLVCSYDSGPVLRGLSAELYPDEFTVIIGPNGAGKSTLLYAVMGFMPIEAGNVEIGERPISDYKRIELAKLIAYVPQESVFSFDYRVEELVLMGRHPYMGVLESWDAEDHRAVGDALTALELETFRKRWYSQLSGGEKQRVLIARALAQNTRYIFLDESLSQLDINHQLEIMRLLARLCKNRKLGIVLISHNLNLAANFADKLIYIKNGVSIGSGTAEELMNSSTLARLFEIELQTAQNPISGRANIIYPI